MSTLVPCSGCATSPVVRCGRCDAPLCGAHRPRRGRRCRRCERDYAERAPLRTRLKAAIAVPATSAAALVGFGLLLPVTGPGLIGSVVVAAGVSIAAGVTGGAIVVGVERSARAQFLREHGCELPEARVVGHLPAGLGRLEAPP